MTRPIGNFLESLSQAILVGIILVRRLGVPQHVSGFGRWEGPSGRAEVSSTSLSSIYLPTYLPTYLSIYLSISLSIYLSIYLPIRAEVSSTSRAPFMGGGTAAGTPAAGTPAAAARRGYSLPRFTNIYPLPRFALQDLPRFTPPGFYEVLSTEIYPTRNFQGLGFREVP